MEHAETFEDLKCWQLACKLENIIKKEVLPKLPNSEKFELKSQLARAARSATAIITEGWGRIHYPDSNKFYYNARGSVSEILDHLIEARDDGYIEENEYRPVKSLVIETLKVLNGFTFYLKREHFIKISI